MLRQIHVAAVLTACIAVAGGRALANDSALSAIGGGAVEPMGRHKSIRMVREKATARLDSESARVRCEFVFKNEGKAVTVTMGFPEKAWAYGDGSTEMRLKGFRSWVDGRLVRTRYAPSGKKGEIPRHEEYRAWYVKKIPFEAGQTRTVVDEYTSELGGSGSVGSEYDAISLFNYILKTGRNWKGPIGQAVVIVDASRFPRTYYDISALPKGYTSRKRTLTWTMRNFEPTGDIEIEFVPRSPKLNGKMINGYSWSPFSVVNGRAMTGLGFIEDALGGSVDDKAKRIRVIKYAGRTLTLKAGSGTAQLDGSRRITLPVAPIAGKYDQFSVPVAAVVRVLGGKARYDWKSRRLNLWLAPASAKRGSSTS
ncbi:MAG: DUF4424 family protein [Armatimonadota bacterium]|nr:DUF4424 family protein [Armatimonadota bacterium]